jgi:pimeloyl-ACP methyl ester carboxylesterase
MEHVRSTDGTPIAFARQGSGEPLLLVHGTTGAGASWALVTPHLEDRFTVVTMDRRGRGESGDGTGYSLDLEADDVAAVVDAVGGGVHVVGHSFGARIVPLAAMRTGGVRSLMLYEPPLALQHMPDGLVDRVEELVRAGDPDAAADAFLGEAGVP